jgi:hypothetical protein
MSNHPHGELRQSQLLTTFGVGSMVDLPDHSVLISGLNHWRGYENHLIEEPRLAQRVSEILNVPQIKLYAPPAAESDPNQPQTGIPVFEFPNWVVAQVDQTYRDNSGKTYQTRPLLPRKRLVKGKYENEKRKKFSVVPVRFVQACRYGHLSDIDWYRFVNPECSRNCPAQLWLDEGGTGNDFSNIFIRCEQCQKRRPLANALLKGILGYCRGDRPWLGKFAREPHPEDQPEMNSLLVRSASNAYFSQVLSVISLPETDQKLRDAVTAVYDDLEEAEEFAELKVFSKSKRIRKQLEGFDLKLVWNEVQRRQKGEAPPTKTIKQAEIETLLSADEVGTDEPDSQFYAYVRPLESLPKVLENKLERIVLIPRLREVRAQVGFTRFEPQVPDFDGELPEDNLDLKVKRAPLDIDTSWIPAIENQGEGIFLHFNQDAIERWLDREAVKGRVQQLRNGFNLWCKRRDIPRDQVKFPGSAYILMHSLSHLLITAISLDCGYSSSAIRERIYGGNSGYGILLYTGSSGSEGTLGGLIEVGKSIEQHLLRALDLGRLCSNDPICSQHRPTDTHEERFLHGAACHGCLLISETSCEQRNEFLDRALVVNTVSDSETAFFPMDS